MKTIRLFPIRTKATPDDSDVRVGDQLSPGLFDTADEVHISVTFTWHLSWAERAAQNWRHVAPVRIGGPATGEPSGDFVPGMYMKRGYVITSRGCPYKCWFCSVPRREGVLRELPVTDGWIVTDDNLLACSPEHIDRVFEMLARQPHKPRFVGGLEARLMTPYLARRLAALRPKSMYFAYDTADDLEPLISAGKILTAAGFSKPSCVMRCYVLIGYDGDTFAAATKRLRAAWNAGFFPMAMLYRDGGKNPPSAEWACYQRTWANPHILGANLKKYVGEA